MLAPLAFLALLPAQQPSNQFRVIPAANLEILFSRDFEPVPPEPASRKESKAHYGWETEAIWKAKAPKAEVRVTYWTYAKGKKPILSPKEIATELYSNCELVNTDAELARSYADRQVIDAQVAKFPATIDLHWDKEQGLQYGTLAFGNDQEQWLIEITGDAKMDGMAKAVRTILGTVRPMTSTKEQLAKGLHKMMSLPGTGFEIAAPASFKAQVSNPDSKRPALWSRWYTLDLTDDYSISVHDDAYKDTKQPNLRADLDYILNSLKDGVRKFGKPADTEGNQGGWTTFMRVLPYTVGDRNYTLVWNYWASPGRTIFATIKVSDRFGGTAKARELAMSLRPEKKKP